MTSSSTEAHVDVDHQDDSVVAPLPPSSAQRKWALVRNVYKGIRRTSSLTPSEARLLESLTGGAQQQQESGKKDDEKEETVAEARQELMASVMDRKSALTEAEAAFLEDLAAAPDVSARCLNTTCKVLNQDTLYCKQDNKNNSSRAQDDDDDTTVEILPGKSPPEGRRSGPCNDSFRIELWSSSSSYNSISKKKKETPKETTPKEKKPADSKKSFLFFFRKSEESPEPEEQEEEEEEAPFEILATSVDDVLAQPHVLSPPLMDALRPHMPFVVQQDNYWLKYSLVRDGASIRTLLSKVRSSARTVLAIETVDGHVFGSFTSSPWRANGNRYYGSGEAFLWRMNKCRLSNCQTPEQQAELESTVQVFGWSGQNRNVQLANPNKLVLGGGEPEKEKDSATTTTIPQQDWGFGLALDSDLARGTSSICVTFGNPKLCVQGCGVFEVANLEVWTMTPVADVPLAEKLELSRQFVFDHGNVLEQ